MKVDKIQEKIVKESLSSFFVSSQPNIFYLSRFKSSNAFILLTPDKKIFITDSRYYEGAKEKLKGWELILLGKDNKNQMEHLREILNEYGGERIGFEEDRTTIFFYKKLVNKEGKKEERLKGELIGYAGFFDEFRISKTEEEIQIIKEAVFKTDKVFKQIVDYIPKAKNELDLRREIINSIFIEGGTGESFPAIVASGKNSAIPHHETSYQKIEKNSPVLIDMGMVYRGYCSDFTRVVFYGKVDPEIEKIYEIVKEAHLKAVEKVKAGVPVREIDEAARSVIKKYGYGDYFIHSTGHGVGIEIHEPPRVSEKSEEILQENTVITIEPGIYIPEKGGVRLENIVVVRKNSCEILTETPLDKVYIR
ncbi:Xaa-Pro aminopeptidase/Xaa-Pro dipeptidase [Persephonella hydrogeniphila]|uniref:Xaa-Pro aminopeptidase/Xaa-Pro dipeptidase n=1 Tax=Persephonella hydrogeniphila TaxID=198703 RepID=A0A285N4I7_9AQUI|nr:Xaa-Pro peptidase family protein [Persephonella hydrogeniphila]SNZ02641.1 Xaa-Pro aminopeptidase/Xaa-Pro dipeptidase [Persephonella hydrogeniphila]